MKDAHPATESIVIECDLPHSPAKVWRALTEQDLLASWLLPNDMRPEVGARFQFQAAGPDVGSDRIDCEVLEVEPNRKLRWRQSEDTDSNSGTIDSVVSVELTARPDGSTHLRLVHSAAIKALATVTQLQPGRSPRMEYSAEWVCGLRRAA
jgi:uncharacterized protein YndB with AHSA1/START domain